MNLDEEREKKIMSTRNTLTDLNDLLFEQLEKIVDPDDDITEEEMKLEIEKAKVVEKIASNIVHIADVSVKATKLKLDYGETTVLPEIVEKK